MERERLFIDFRFLRIQENGLLHTPCWGAWSRSSLTQETEYTNPAKRRRFRIEFYEHFTVYKNERNTNVATRIELISVHLSLMNCIAVQHHSQLWLLVYHGHRVRGLRSGCQQLQCVTVEMYFYKIIINDHIHLG